MPPSIVTLPPRSGSMQFPDEDVSAVIDLLRQCEPGQAVRLTDDPDETDNTARRRSELLKEQAEKMLAARAKTLAEPPAEGADPPAAEPNPADVAGVVKAGFKIRGHVLTEGDATVTEHTSKKSGKTYKVTSYPKNWAAVSLVPENEPDPETPATPETPPAETPPAETPAETPAPSRKRR